jgi:TfoX/Sxy family transcriptional regulator of competence genes
MPYDKRLAERVRIFFDNTSNVEEKKMMGGLTFMGNGKMCVGVLQNELMARINPDVFETARQENRSHEMNFTGKPMKGFVFIRSEGTKTKKIWNIGSHLLWIVTYLQNHRNERINSKDNSIFLSSTFSYFYPPILANPYYFI